MTSKNISLKKEAYEFLKSLKSGDKSFSDVVLELRQRRYVEKQKKDIMKYFGILKDKKDWDETEKIMKDFRKSFDKRVERTIKYMGEARKK